MSDPDISNILPVSNQAVRLIQQEARQAIAKAVESDGNLSQYVENTLFNPMNMAQKFRELDKLKTPQNKEQIENPEEEKIVGVESSEETASRFQKNNPELSSRTLFCKLLSKKEIRRRRFWLKSFPSTRIQRSLTKRSIFFLKQQGRFFSLNSKKRKNFSIEIMQDK